MKPPKYIIHRSYDRNRILSYDPIEEMYRTMITIEDPFDWPIAASLICTALNAVEDLGTDIPMKPRDIKE